MKRILAVLTLTAATAICPFNPPCPLHDVAITHLIRTEFSEGHQVGIYGCSRGHEFVMRCDH